MRLLVVALIASTPAVAIPAPLPDRGPQPFAKSVNCPRTTSHHARQRGIGMRSQKLTELPDANAYAAVYRHVRGCEVPVVVKYGVSQR